jgi:hypothetical protein
MIRQAHTYLVGALSGVVVIGIAIAAFVVLVSAQVFHDLPIPALSSSDQKAAVSQNQAVSSPNTGAVATTGVGAPQTSQGNTNPNPSGGPNGPTGAATPGDGQRHQANAGTPADDATGPAEVVETAPTTTTTSTGGSEGNSTSGGNSGGSSDSQPSSTSKSPSSSSPGSVGGNNSNSNSGTSGNSGSSSCSPTNTQGSSGGAPSTGTSGGGSSTTTSPPPTPVTTAKPSETITETVNGTVGTVDEALGGTLSETGVSKVTEEVVNGVAGPESVVGKTVDGVGEVVGGLVGGHGQ